MTTAQIYTLVNEVASQCFGTSALAVCDTSSLVSMGDTVLSSSTNTENFVQTLVQRIGRTIIRFRDYENQLGNLVMDDFHFGAIVQKISVDMPSAEADQSHDLENGVSVDMFKVAKPKVTQKLFVTRTPYQFHVTIQEHTLREAFTSDSAMGSFIGAIYGEVKNRLEVAIEELGRLCICNYMANAKDTQVVNLVSNYNSARSLSGTNVVTAKTAMFNADFLRYAIGQINLYAKKMRTLSTLYNGEGAKRFTPLADQYYAVLADFETQLETVVQYSAFHTQFVEKAASFDVPFWQSALTPAAIDVKVQSGEEVKIENIVAFIFDREALGTYRQEKTVLSTPMNAAGAYFNVYWHEKQLWFNDLSENGIIFTLN